MRDRRNYWANQSRGHLSRRRVLGGAAAGSTGLAGLALVGCGNDDEDSPNGNGNGNGADLDDADGLQGNTSEIDLDLEEFREIYHGRHLSDLPHAGRQPERGGTFRMSSVSPTSWDPTGPAAQQLPSYALIHNQLIRFHNSDDMENHNFQEVEADVAQSMPEQPDELTYTFKLRPEVEFADLPPVDGRSMTAEDIVYSFEAYRDSPAQAPTFNDVESIETPDEETIVIRTGVPAAYFLDTLVITYHWIFSPEQHDQGGMDRNPIGTGPFMLASEEELGGYVYERNPNYWKHDEHGTQLPYLDRIEGQYIPSPVDADAAFRNGAIDHRWPQTYDSWRELVTSNPNVVTQVTTPPPSAQPFFVMNLDEEPLNDVRVRRAMSLAIDRQAIIDSLAGGMADFGYGMDFTYFGREWPFEPDELGDYHHYDPERARELLAEAGYENGIPEPIHVFNRWTAGLWFEVSVAAMEMWRQVGIEIEHDYSQDQAQWQSLYYGTTYEQMMLVSTVGPGYDPDAFTYQSLHSESPRNYFHVDNPDLDRLCEQQRHEMDVDARQDLIRQIMDIDLDEVYRIWLILTYKINLRHPHVYNVADAMAAWAPVGWGSHNLEQTWLVDGGN